MNRSIFRASLAVFFILISGNLKGGCCQAQPTKNTKGTIAVINGDRVITEKEIDEALGAQLYALQEKIYVLRKKALESLVIQILLKEEAKRKGLPYEEFKQQLMPERVEVKQQDIDRAYADNLSVLENMNEDEAKQRIRLDLESQLKFDKYKAAVAEIISRATVEVFLTEPLPPLARITVAGPSKGPSDAPVTIVEFSDFQCPYCKQAAMNLRSLIQSYGSDVRVIFKQMPLSIHPDAFKAAQASVCADEQGKFWEYHDVLFQSSDLSLQALKKYAADLGLKPDLFNTCVSSEMSAITVRKDMQEARLTDVQGTPTFFVNGRIIRGINSLDEFKNLINQALKQRQKETKQPTTQ